jgi:hypothetical protein
MAMPGILNARHLSHLSQVVWMHPNDFCTNRCDANCSVLGAEGQPRDTAPWGVIDCRAVIFEVTCSSEECIPHQEGMNSYWLSNFLALRSAWLW